MINDRVFRTLFLIVSAMVMVAACVSRSDKDSVPITIDPNDGDEIDELATSPDEIDAIPIDAIDPMGTWEVLSFEGGIHDERVGGGMEILCDYYDNYYKPVLASEDTFIHLVPMTESDPDFGDIPQDMVDAFNMYLGSSGIFVFSFAFDNGFHSNRALEDLQVHFLASELVPGLVSAMVGGFNEETVLSEVRSMAPGGGENKFQVTGRFVRSDRLEGEWYYEETTSLPGNPAPECVSAAEGLGTWVAEKR